MVLENLKGGLKAAIKKLVHASDVNEELIDALSKDVQRALIQSDVNVKLVLAVTKALKERALNEEPPKGLSKKDHLVIILYGELSRMLGYSGDTITTIDKSERGAEEHPITTFLKPGKQNVILMLGIQGSGKTTVTSKLARWLTRHGFSVGVIGADTWRPGALTQLQMNCLKSNVEVYGEETDDAVAIVRNGLAHFNNQKLDVVIIDTAGRHKEEAGLLQEMAEMHGVATPDLVLLVIDGTLGQRAQAQAEAFHKTAPVGGIIITKLDGTAKGGGAIAASSVTGAKVMFIGTGERMDDLEEFSPTEYVGKLLGIGDIKALLKLANELQLESDEDATKRILGGKMTIEDFYSQMDQMNKMGLRNFLDAMPEAKVDEKKLEGFAEKIQRWRFIIQSMTKQERKHPDLINDARKKRIARGAGVPEMEVREMLKQYENSKMVLKQYKGRNMGSFLRKMGINRY